MYVSLRRCMTRGRAHMVLRAAQPRSWRTADYCTWWTGRDVGTTVLSRHNTSTGIPYARRYTATCTYTCEASVLGQTHCIVSLRKVSLMTKPLTGR